MTLNNRRVVTGLDGAGMSAVIFDDRIRSDKAGEEVPVTMVWRANSVPASNEGNADAGNVPFDFASLNDGGANFVMLELQPGTEPVMHATNSLDFLFVIRGRVLLKLEAEEVELGAGDLIVDRGVLHGWTALGQEPALLACVTIPAVPLGEGARMA